MKLKVIDVCKSFDGKQIIKDINLYINKGETVSVLGVSGVGKTTLFNIISGITKPDSGQIFLDNEDITHKIGKISYMLQKDLLLPYKTILENVSLPLIIRGDKIKEAKKKAAELFKEFGIDGTENSYPYELSGGMKQRAAFLRTYLFSNDVVLLDEPFSALDMITKSKMQKWYIDLAEKKSISTLVITHDINEAIYLSDRIYIMKGYPAKLEKEIIVAKDKKDDEIFLKYKREIVDIIE